MIEKLELRKGQTKDGTEVFFMPLSDKQMLDKFNEIIETVNYLERAVEYIQSRDRIMGDR